jgi:phosphohistidine phosphatase
MLLYLIRHGIAIDRADPDCPAEADRFLTPKGIERMRRAAAGIARLDPAPDCLLTSPYTRARQTAAIVAGGLGIPEREWITTPALLPEAHPRELYTELKRLRAATVMASGHAPNVDEVIAYALGNAAAATALKKGAMAVLELGELRAGEGLLLGLYPPKVLRLLGRPSPLG